MLAEMNYAALPEKLRTKSLEVIQKKLQAK
jgi:hypothetical protein